MKDYYKIKKVSNSSLSWFQNSPKYFKLMFDNGGQIAKATKRIASNELRAVADAKLLIAAQSAKKGGVFSFNDVAKFDHSILKPVVPVPVGTNIQKSHAEENADRIRKDVGEKEDDEEEDDEDPDHW